MSSNRLFSSRILIVAGLWTIATAPQCSAQQPMKPTITAGSTTRPASSQPATKSSSQSSKPAAAKAKQVRRAQLPEPSTLRSPLFFADAFAEGLVGPRPVRARADSRVATPTGGALRETSSPVDSSEPRSAQWSTVISRQTLEDEIKRLQISLTQGITTPTKFTSGGYKSARHDFAVLAALFAVAAQYDQDVRWKEQAATARDLLSRAAANMKVSSTQSYNEAKQRKVDLEEMVRGGRIAINADAAADQWERAIDREPLMQYLDSTQEERVLPALASAKAFAANKQSLQRHAELIAMIASVLTQPEMEDANDKDYTTFSRELHQAARQLTEATVADDYGAAVAASGVMSQSCDNCHETYR